MDLRARPAAQLSGLWAVLTALRWLAALPIAEPRIFRDELLHWQMAKAFAAHQPFLFIGQAIDYPAFLYPAALSLVFHLGSARLAFDLAQGLNAAFASAVVFPAYGLAREFGSPAPALAAAAIAGLAPGGVYSALIMEESLYYPLFVLSCWLCFRVLTRGRAMEASACGLALCLTYFTKPLGALLVGAYAIFVLGWSVLQLSWRDALRVRAPGLVPRLIPLAAFAAALVARRALFPGGAGLGSASELVLSRFYAEELSGPLLPSFLSLAAVAIALCASLALGTGAVPGASLLSLSRSTLSDRRRASYVCFAALVVATYVVAAARHTLLLNDPPRIHERYLFAVGPLLVTAPLLADRPPIGRVAIGLLCVVIVLAVGPLGSMALTDRTWVDAPSLTVPWQARRILGGGLAAALTGSLALLVAVAARRAPHRPWASFAWMSGLLLMLNGGWYASLYRQTYLDETSRLVHRLQDRLGPTERITVVQDGSDALASVSRYLKFWLDIPVTGYWVGSGAAPWYADLSGEAAHAVDRTAASYVVASPGFETLCPGAHPAPEIEPGPALPVVVLEVPKAGCGKPEQRIIPSEHR
ncbi:MAG TPA: glycosyltransferase family 39 protein [Gemmatimonadales bacterium]|nr:glycosyltransferase family 39 protein [Gemmatimonadales bacterium]